MLECSIQSPYGALTIVENNGAIAALRWGGGHADDTPLLREAAAQLVGYFAGACQSFNLPITLAPGLTGKVMHAMCAIPFGETRTYGELARDLGASAQAIGQACGANPIPIIVPCHRILGASGLGGYSGGGGIETKIALLRHEGAAGLLI